MTATALTVTTTSAAARHDRYTRILLAVAAVMITAIGITLITLGVVTGQPGLTVVASASMAAGGTSVATAYSAHRKAQR